MKEFVDIPGFEGLYSINKEGDVKNIIKNNDRFLKKFPNNGYLCYRLYKDKKQHKLLAHRAIALTFIPNPENKPIINHIDGNCQNNDISNLEWCTYAENTTHSYRVLGRKSIWKGKFGAEHNRSKPVSQFSIDGKTLIKVWNNAVEIENELGFFKSNIRCCCLGKYKFSHGYKWSY